MKHKDAKSLNSQKTILNAKNRYLSESADYNSPHITHHPFLKQTLRLCAFALIFKVMTLSLSAENTGALKVTDITQQAGIHFVHSIGDDELSNIVESTGAGVLFFDYDNDGDMDMYFVNGCYRKEISHLKGRKMKGKLKNALYRNDGKGHFEDVTDQAGVGDIGYGMSCLSGDLDNDGDRDLYITNYGPNVFYRNNGDGTFTDVTEKSGLQCDLWSTGVTFLDFDRDGYLDVFVGNYLDFDPEYRTYFAAEAFPGPLAYKGVKDMLFRNNGDGTFCDVSKKSGIGSLVGRAMGVASCDINADGYMDIFVANDAMENYLYINNKNGTFSESGLLAGVGFGQNGEATSAMGPEFSDFNRDGFVDILVPDMSYSCIYTNSGEGYFTEVSARSGVSMSCGQYTSWSGNAFDFDLDSLVDIFICNGDSHHLEPEEDLMFINQGDTKFKDISSALGKDFQDKFVSRGSAVGDIDNDGDLDIAILNINDRARLLRNDCTSGNHWLMIDLEGTASNRDAVGSVVKITTERGVQTRYVVSSSGYLSQSDSRVHFGLGKNRRIKMLEVMWPNGGKTTLKDIKADQVLSVKEGQ